MGKNSLEQTRQGISVEGISRQGISVEGDWLECRTMLISLAARV